MTDVLILLKSYERAWQTQKWNVDRFWVDYDNYAWKNELFEREYYRHIFSHDFAKAFWGDGLCGCGEHQVDYSFYEWEHHLQQMVLEPEPLKYLEKYL